jgi:hypothetical protein
MRQSRCSQCILVTNEDDTRFNDVINNGIGYCQQTFEEMVEELEFDLETEKDEAVKFYDYLAAQVRLVYNVIGNYSKAADLSEDLEITAS